MDKKVLLIVEGDSDEVSFVKKLFSKCNRQTDYKIYTYKTNIHVISQELYNNYNDFDNGDVDIRLVLASKEIDTEKKKILLDNYSDIYMIFDFEPQHNNPHFDTIKRMVDYYTDSTNQGKLYINYPMMQSYKHLDCLPCPEFEDTKVLMDDIKNYKKTVGEISCCNDLNKYSYITFLSIAVHHLKKVFKILNNKFVLPTINEYLEIDYCEIYDTQLDNLNERNFVYVLNTSIFIMIDFSPNKVFNYIFRHWKELMI